MKCFYPVAIVLVLLAGCKRNQAQPVEKAELPIVLSAPLEFQMSQRSTTTLPGSNDRILITIDDITSGQVMTSLSWRDGNVIVATRSMRQNDRVIFTVNGHACKLKLKRLTNVLTGEDTARFELSPAAAESIEKHKVPIALNVPVEFNMWQRTTSALPNSDDKLLLTLDDITGGQVLVTLSWYDGKPVIATRSLRENDIVAFTVSNHAYKLELKTLTNKLIGGDSAIFQLWPATTEAEKMLLEQEKIEKLIFSLVKLLDARFIRNNQEHTVVEAIDHMTEKWKWNKSAIKTAEDFITKIGSKSSVTGELYLIKLPDGTIMKLEEWFREQLEIIEKPTTGSPGDSCPKLPQLKEVNEPRGQLKESPMAH